MGLCMTAQMDAGVTGFTNGNCLIQDGQSYAGAGLVYNTEITCAEPHPSGMSSQKAELTALKKSLEQRKDETVMAHGVPLLTFMSMGPFIRRGAF